MARSAINDPLEKFRFQLTWTSSGGGSEGTVLSRMGFHDVQMPKRTTTKIGYREGVDPDVKSLSAGLSSMEDIIFSRGLLVQDKNNEFYSWMSAVHNPSSGVGTYNANNLRASNSAALNYRKDVTLTMLDREGNAARTWTLYNAFPMHFTPGSDLNAGEDGDKSLEGLTLAYEDFQEEQVTGLNTVAIPTSPSL